MSTPAPPCPTPGTPTAPPAQLTPSAPPVAWPDAQRQAAFEGWWALTAPAHALEQATLSLASADASFRRYLRARTPDGRSAIVMDAPPALEDCRPFVHVAALMAQAGVHVPQVLAWDAAAGFMLLTDLGDTPLMALLDPAQPEAALPYFKSALDALIAWQRASRPDVLPAYDAALLGRELQLFPDWYVDRHRAYTLSDAQRLGLNQTFDLLVRDNLSAASVYVHRDFMPRNLMAAHSGAAGLGVLDFQDAVYGPITYDIASLMRDAFISWDEEMVIDVTVRYWTQARAAQLPVDADFGRFYRQVEWMGLQRHLKVAGIFARLSLRDGKPRYLADTPRFIAYIRATCARYRELTPLLRLVDAIEGLQAPTGWCLGRPSGG